MAEVFDRDKYDRYAARVEAAGEAYRSSSDQLRFESDELSKMVAFFHRDFYPSTKQYTEVYDAVNQASKTHLTDLPAIEAEVKRVLALAEEGSQHKRHLRAICDQIIVKKRAEIKRDAASQHSKNLLQCWGQLQEFARPHIISGLQVGRMPVAGQSPAMAGGHHA
jgi:hypothetical protein